MTYDRNQLEQLRKLINESENIVVIQAEHIDADSLGSALALEQALGDLGKEVTMYAANEVPKYLQSFLPGWDRVTEELPNTFDLSILVDCATTQQLDRTLSAHKAALSKRPFVVIDHHPTQLSPIPFATLEIINNQAGAAAQMIYEIGKELGWNFNQDSAYSMVAGIKGDTGNLSYNITTPSTFRAMAELVEIGVDLEKQKNAFEATQSIPVDQLHLKAEILKRARFFHNKQIAVSYVTLEEYKSLGEDTLLVEQIKQDLLGLKEVLISVTITERKDYSNASMRAVVDVAGKTAEHFNGGGHSRAASCRFMNAKHSEVIKQIVPTISRFLEDVAV